MAFLARHNPLAIIPVAIMFGGIVASGGLVQRRMDLPDATVLVLQGLTFVVLLVSETLYGRFKIFQVQAHGGPHMSDNALVIVLFAIVGGALRVSTPFMFVALGECLTEKSGRVNLGLEGTLVLGAMSAYAISYHTGSPWLGVLAAGCAGACLGAMHGYICKLPKVNDIAIGIAMMLFGTGIAFFFGKAYIQPSRAAARLVLARRLDRQPADRDGAADQSAAARRHRRRDLDGLGLRQHQMGPDRPHDRRQRAVRARRWASRSIWCASSRPPSAASSPASAARSCRSTIRAPGTRACRRARA